jgi:hypothetical protein
MSTSFVWPAKVLALHLPTMPDGSMGDHSEVSMLINQNYCHGPKQEKHTTFRKEKSEIKKKSISYQK